VSVFFSARVEPGFAAAVGFSPDAGPPYLGLQSAFAYEEQIALSIFSADKILCSPKWQARANHPHLPAQPQSKLLIPFQT
jgi:hypothetical protein